MWDSVGNRLWWVDIPAGLVHCFDPESASDNAVSVGRPVGFVALRFPRESGPGGLIAVTADGIFAVSPSPSLLFELDSPAGGRANDGKADAAGRLWAGMMIDGAPPGHAALWRIDVDGSVDVVLEGLTIPNGIDWSPDGTAMYYVDSPTRRIDRLGFDRRTGAVGERQAFVSWDEDVLPDGLTVDAEGGVWVALWGGSRVERYTADGVLDTVVHVPVSQASSCTFGGPDLDVLYITSAAAGLSDEQLAAEPAAGGLFACTPGHIGRPPNMFLG